MSMDLNVFKAAMGQLASGVTVITMRDGEEDHGFTASSFTSVSIDPMLVLVCVIKGQRSHTLIEQSKAFAVNILELGQKELGIKCASSKTADRFAGVKLERAVTGSAIVSGSLAWVDCKLHSTLPGGDHSIFVGEVVAGAAPGQGKPLCYFNRAWGDFRAEG